jgi:hypothetical protein
VPPPCAFLPEKHETWLISDMSDATGGGRNGQGCDKMTTLLHCKLAISFLVKPRATVGSLAFTRQS